MYEDLAVMMSREDRIAENEIQKKMALKQHGTVFIEAAREIAAGLKPIIEPCESQGSHYQYSIDASGAEIVRVLGFDGNVEEQEGYGASWAFKVNGEYCAIWFHSAGGSARAFGPLDKLRILFGERVHA